MRFPSAGSHGISTAWFSCWILDYFWISFLDARALSLVVLSALTLSVILFTGTFEELKLCLFDGDSQIYVSIHEPHIWWHRGWRWVLSLTLTHPINHDVLDFYAQISHLFSKPHWYAQIFFFFWPKTSLDKLLHSKYLRLLILTLWEKFTRKAWRHLAQCYPKGRAARTLIRRLLHPFRWKMMGEWTKVDAVGRKMQARIQATASTRKRCDLGSGEVGKVPEDAFWFLALASG